MISLASARGRVQYIDRTNPRPIRKTPRKKPERHHNSTARQRPERRHTPAARNGIKVAFIQDRPVLGGNNSSEVRVWLSGKTNGARYPRIGDVVGELEQEKREERTMGPRTLAKSTRMRKNWPWLSQKKTSRSFSAIVATG